MTSLIDIWTPAVAMPTIDAATLKPSIVGERAKTWLESEKKAARNFYSWSGTQKGVGDVTLATRLRALPRVHTPRDTFYGLDRQVSSS